MPFHRFEHVETKLSIPHLSRGSAPVIEGQYLHFRLFPTPAQQRIDTMSPQEQARARVERKAS